MFCPGSQHCEKLEGSPSPEQVEEQAKLKLSCYLNLAQCWLKLGKLVKAKDNCNKVRGKADANTA